MELINLHDILRKRVPHGNLIPGFLITGLEKLIHQDELNEVLRTCPGVGSEFCNQVYDFFDLSIDVKGMENIPDNGRFIFASNHPLGGLDGIGLIKILGGRYGDDNIRFLVNDMLMNVEPLRNVFLPINKYGSQGRHATARINEAYQGDCQMLIFPAGLVSRLHDDGTIADLAWQKSFIAKAIEYRRDIIPVHFEGLNRMRFYRTARMRRKLGLKVNVEQALLPGEVCASRGKHFTVTFGKPISWQSLRDSDIPLPLLAARLRQKVHDMH